MSTICKLNPNVREARARRARVLRELHGIRSTVRSVQEVIMLDNIITCLEAVKSADWMDGRRKETRFKTILSYKRDA